MSNSLTSICPHCGTVNTQQTGIGHANAPSPGDVAVCIECYGASVWTSLGGLRVPTDAEHDQIEAYPEMRALRAAIASKEVSD